MNHEGCREFYSGCDGLSLFCCDALRREQKFDLFRNLSGVLLLFIYTNDSTLVLLILGIWRVSHSLKRRDEEIVGYV